MPLENCPNHPPSILSNDHVSYPALSWRIGRGRGADKWGRGKGRSLPPKPRQGLGGLVELLVEAAVGDVLDLRHVGGRDELLQLRQPVRRAHRGRRGLGNGTSYSSNLSVHSKKNNFDG